MAQERALAIRRMEEAGVGDDEGHHHDNANIVTVVLSFDTYSPTVMLINVPPRLCSPALINFRQANDFY